MLQFTKGILKETILFLILLNVAIFLVPKSLRIITKFICKCLYKIVNFVTTQLYVLAKKGIVLYKQRQKQLNRKDQVAQAKNVICLNHYKKAK